MRRLRQTGLLRGMVRETELTPSHLVQPMFVELGTDSRTAIAAMPGVERLSISHAVEEAGRAHALGVPAVLLFGLPAEKDDRASGAYDDEGVVQLAVRALKEAHPELVVITDVCLCAYTSHGHCGVIRGDGAGGAQADRHGRSAAGTSFRRAPHRRLSAEHRTDDAGGAQADRRSAEHRTDDAGGAQADRRSAEHRTDDSPVVDNDVSLELLAKTAISHAAAGADAVAPSDMMDGRVGALRAQLDAEDHKDTPIVAYSAKFASAFYGPFRDAVDSAPAFGDRRTYQMDPANSDEAVREALLDVEEGADVVMVKPALPYLDVIRRVKEATRVPVAAYNVSGEYAMIEAAAAAGYLDRRAAVLEALTSIRRAGADIVITYHARQVAEWLQ